MKFFVNLTFFTLLLFTQCTSSPAPENTPDTPAPTENAETVVERDQTQTDAPKQVAQQPEIDQNHISPSGILKDNAERYAKLYKRVTGNLTTINNKIDGSTLNENIKKALKSSYAEIAKYDNIHDIAKTSEQTSAETIVPYITGLEGYLNQFGIK